jgi:hypothetical protein
MSLNGCAGNTTMCDGLDLAPVKLGLRPQLIVMCSGCRRAAAAMGAHIVERRVAAVPVAIDRRRFVAPWRRSLVARDLTGALR